MKGFRGGEDSCPLKQEAFGLLGEVVGARGFEPRTSCAQGKRATRLRHAPTFGGIRRDAAAQTLPDRLFSVEERRRISTPSTLFKFYCVIQHTYWADLAQVRGCPELGALAALLIRGRFGLCFSLPALVLAGRRRVGIFC